ncbi:MAG TPA: HAMP domain-containing sensor histidine kinase [Pseudogracilibacillus sp.]|nr:HAMP domain-containing sensor histidine kinase [Pseudogracilibacillus sp.]
MNLNITARYLISVIFIFITVFLVNSFIFLGLIFYQQVNGTAFFTSEYGEDFARSFADDFSIDDDNIILSPSGYEKLEESGVWIEILDENGTVVQSFPSDHKSEEHYRPIELIHRYKYMDDDLNTYFIGEFAPYSYLVINPNLDVSRYTFLVNNENIFRSTLVFITITFLVNLLISLLIGYIFSHFFTSPIKRMTKHIRALKDRVFIKDRSTEKGIYKQVFADLNDVAKTLNEFDRERNKLEKMRNDWIRNVSHDIKTPLSSIRGYAELLKSEALTDDERLHYARVVERQSLYIRELLDDFNLSLRLRNNEIALQIERTDIVVFVREIVIDLLNDPQFQSEDIEFLHDQPSSFWEIDRHLMKRAILNLIYNALIHNEDVTVKVIISHDLITIEDNGIGITEEEQEMIFERYYRATNTKDIQGTGLGMAIAHDIIKAHEGRISLESELNKGSKFSISMNKKTNR